MSARIDSVSSRQRLKPRRGPYWHRISKGCYLGYRKMSPSGDGTWLARVRDVQAGEQHQRYKALGEFGELPGYLRFDMAQKAARAWFDHRRASR